MRLSVLAGVAAIAIGLSGCAGLFGPGKSLRLRTDSVTYTPQVTGGVYDSFIYGFRVIAHFENRSDDTVYLERCSPIARMPTFGVVFANGSRGADAPAYDMPWACGGHDQHFAVPPGAVRIDTLQLRGPNTFDGITHEPNGALQGEFRLLYGVQSCQDGGGCKIPGAGLSNAFHVFLPPQD